jgi:hypothetical protein
MYVFYEDILSVVTRLKHMGLDASSSRGTLRLSRRGLGDRPMTVDPNSST